MTSTAARHAARLTIDYPDRSLDRRSTALRLLYILPILIVLGLIGGTTAWNTVGETGAGVGVLGAGVLGGPVLLMVLFRNKYPCWWFDFNLQLAATHLTVGMIGLVLVVGVGRVAFDLNPPGAWRPAVVAITASAVMVVAVGFLLAAVTPTVRTTQAISAAIYFPAIFVSGVVFPTEALPELARRIGQILPFTYGVRAIREAWVLGATDWTAFAVLAATVVVTVAIALRTFRWKTRY